MKSQFQTVADDLRKTEENLSVEHLAYSKLKDALNALDEQLHNLELVISEKVHYIANLEQRRETLRDRVRELLDASE